MNMNPKPTEFKMWCDHIDTLTHHHAIYQLLITGTVPFVVGINTSSCESSR